METKIIEEIKEELRAELNYNFLKNKKGPEFRIFVIQLFTRLSHFKNKGLTQYDLFEFTNDLFYEAGDYFDHDPLFEQRFGVISEEIMDLGSLPSFWNIDLKEYLQKWDKYFEYEKKEGQIH